MCSPLNGFLLFVSLKAYSYCTSEDLEFDSMMHTSSLGDGQSGVMHTAEIDLAL